LSFVTAEEMGLAAKLYRRMTGRSCLGGNR